jgi:hypothetical protein
MVFGSSCNCTIQMALYSVVSFSFIVYVICDLSMVFVSFYTKLLIILLISYTFFPPISSKSQPKNVLESIHTTWSLKIKTLMNSKYTQQQKLHSMHMIAMTTMILTKIHNNETNHQMTTKTIMI